MGKIRILIVEDNRIIADDMKSRLQNIGYEVTTITVSGSGALTQINKSPPDLVLMDINLQGKMDGIKTADLIRSRFDIPVVYVTAYSDFKTLVMAKKTEPYGFITKPFEDKELRAVIDTAVYKHGMEKKLREREAWLFTSLRSIGDAVITTDMSGKITFMNPVASELTGWKEDEARGKLLKRVFKIINMDTGKLVEKPVERVIMVGKVVDSANNTVLIAKDGRHIPIDDSSSPIKDDKGKIIGDVLTFKDITERKKAEKERESLLHDMGERIKELQCMYWVAESIRKHDVLSDIFKDVVIYIPPSWNYPEITRGKIRFDDVEFVSASFEETKWRQCSDIVIDGKRHGSVEVYYLEKRPELDEGPFLKEERNLIDGIAHTLGEAIERKQMENELKESEARFHNLTNFLPEAIYEADLKGKITFANQSAFNLFGYNQEDINKGIVGADLMVKDQLDIVMENTKKIISGEDLGWTEYTAVRKNGSQFPMKSHANVIIRDNKPVGMRGIVIDVTERKKAEEQIQRDLKEKDILLKEIYHRVKNNLQVISSLLGLQARKVKDEQAIRAFEESRDRVRSMAVLHEQLYQSGDLARIEFGKYIKGLANELHRAYSVDPGRVVLDIRFEEVFLEINRAVPCGLIINELISNALQHGFPPSFQGKGKIQVLLRKAEGDEVELIVKDNGVGIPKELDIRETDSLGMKLVSILAEDQLNGAVKLDRRGGTKFIIRFKCT